MSSYPVQPPTGRFVGSSLSAKLAAGPALVAILALGVSVTDRGPGDVEHEAFVCRTAAAWRAEHGDDPALRVARIDVRFGADAGTFTDGEGVVVAPVGVDVPGLQRVVATDAFPASLAAPVTYGQHRRIWAYPGRVHRDMHFTALALVRGDDLATAQPVDPGAIAEYARQVGSRADADARDAARSARIADDWFTREASMRGAKLLDHGLGHCAWFHEGSRELAVGETSADAFLALASAAGARLADAADADPVPLPFPLHEEPCSRIREGALTAHLAQVGVVMGAREADMPSLAFAGAEPHRRYLAGVRISPRTWRVVDLSRTEDGYLDDVPVLLSMAPRARAFPFALHSHWDASAAAFGTDGSPLAHTTWIDGRAVEVREVEGGDTAWPRAGSSVVATIPLAELCS